MVLSRTFTLCVDGAPTIVFAASNLSEARQLRAEQWLLDDLCSFKTNGKFLCTSTSKLLVRKALPDEVTSLIDELPMQVAFTTN
jgi:hypothetical protein